MRFVPILSTTNLQRSLRFYTEVLDFQVAPYDADLTSPVIDLVRAGEMMQLTTLGENPLGLAINVDVDEVDELFASYLKRGLEVRSAGDSPVHNGPVDQTWGTREFYVNDPDGNTLRFRTYAKQ